VSHLYAHWAIEVQTSNISCAVQIRLTEDGIVEDLTFIDCAEDELLRESIRRAVSEASPLPVPDKKDCFESDIVFTFEYPRG
jgi:membrane protein involved in colicin uptake